MLNSVIQGEAAQRVRVRFKVNSQLPDILCRGDGFSFSCIDTKDYAIMQSQTDNPNINSSFYSFTWLIMLKFTVNSTLI